MDSFESAGLTVYAVLIAFGLACSGCSNCVDDRTESQNQGVNLSARWVADGYSCSGDYIEVVDVTHEEDGSVQATKIVGDPCIGSGELTFRGEFKEPLDVGDERTIEWHSGSGWEESVIRIDSADRFTVDDHTFRRSSSEDLNSVGIDGNWNAIGYECEGDRLREKVEISESDDQVEAVKIEGDDCIGSGKTTWSGARDGNPFSVDFVVIRGGSKETREGEIEVVAHDFLILRGSDFNSIRYWTAGLFESD